jgi:ribokinase
VTVIVVGSANADVLISLAEFPSPGETLISHEVRGSFGGKGLNQVVAAAAAGVPARFVACVGTDAVAGRLRDFVAGRGVDVAWVRAVDGPSGAAYVMHRADGQNAIIIAPGANGALTPQLVAEALVAGGCGVGDVVVVQGEIPADSTLEAVRLAAGAGARAVVNLAPVIEVDAEVLRRADPLVVNEHEAARLLGVGAAEVVADPGTAAVRLLGRSRSVVITLGAAGLVAVTADGSAVRLQPPVIDRVVDTTGAGDAFVGVLAARLSRGDDLLDGADAAMRAASESVRHAGTAESYPDFRGFTGRR